MKRCQIKKQNARTRKGTTVSSFRETFRTTKGTLAEDTGNRQSEIDEGSASDNDYDELHNNLNKIREYLLNINTHNKLIADEEKNQKVRENVVKDQNSSLVVYKVPRLIPEEFVKNCSGCDMNFGVCRWKYHCRVCGFVFCFYCSWNFDSFLPFYVQAVRICNRCISQQKNKNYSIM